MKMTAEDEPKKILFRLPKGDDGYPPDDWESLWASEVEPGLFSIDNIPFFVRGVSWGDVVSAESKQDEWHFKQVVRPSSHSVVRIIVYEESDVETIRDELRGLGCDTEKSHIPGLIAVDIPPTTSYDEVVEILTRVASRELLDYEEASIRHS